MPTPTYTPLANLTLGANQATVSFTSIDQSYKDLVIIINGGVTPQNGATGVMRFNGSTNTEYSTINMSGDGFNKYTSAGSSRTSLTVGFWGGGWVAPLVNMAKIQILDYSATNKWKSIFQSATNPTYPIIDYNGCAWYNSSAITSITFDAQFGANYWVAGTTFAIYGIAG